MQYRRQLWKWQLWGALLICCCIIVWNFMIEKDQLVTSSSSSNSTITMPQKDQPVSCSSSSNSTPTILEKYPTMLEKDQLVTSSSSSSFCKSNTTSKGLVYYKGTVAGWNNQRQTAMVAWVVALLTGHALVHNPYVVGKTIHQPGEFWDVKWLSKYVELRNRSDAPQLSHYDYVFDNDNITFTTPKHVTEQLSTFPMIHFDSFWAFTQHIFPWLHPWNAEGMPIFKRLMESFTYVQQIHDLADRVLSEMGEGQRPFVALHVRKERLPVLNCSLLNLKVLRATKKYYRGGCNNTNWDNVLKLLWPEYFGINSTITTTTKEKHHPTLSSPPIVYVATDGSASQNLLYDNDQTYHAKSFSFLQSEQPPIISAVEQVVAIQATYFLASTHSSWSEYVILKRALLSRPDARTNFDIMVDLMKYFHKPFQMKLQNTLY